MKMIQYIAFLRGINVGGHHKVPMADLRKVLEKMGFKNTITLLNSGNIIFEAPQDKNKNLENTLSLQLEEAFGFSIPIIIRRAQSIVQLVTKDPFKGITISKDIRLYVSLLKEKTPVDLELPWANDDDSFKILEITQDCIISILDLAIAKTPKAMGVLEKTYGKNITTRNWKTIERIYKKINIYDKYVR
jgi:uncharacterized protein (DUF1697 family)